jgi:Matrixin
MPERAAALASPASSCGADARNNAGYKISGTFIWYFNPAPTPSYLDVSATERALINAHIEWVRNLNHCGLPDQAEERVIYGGRKQVGFKRDGMNTVSFGPSSLVTSYCGTTGTTEPIACTYEWFRNGLVTESDTILSTSADWATDGGEGKEDVWSVMAHEFGHTLGFGHVTSPDNVMYPTIPSGDTSNRILGRGDALENNAKYRSAEHPAH